MSNKITPHPVYLTSVEKEYAKIEAESLGISVSGFFRMLLNLWKERFKENSKT